MLTKRKPFLNGGLAASLVTACLVVGLSDSTVQAQRPQPLPSGGRYQITSFTIREGPGAYILDTRTGEIFQVVGKSAPERIGSISQLQAKDPAAPEAKEKAKPGGESKRGDKQKPRVPNSRKPVSVDEAMKSLGEVTVEMTVGDVEVSVYEQQTEGTVAVSGIFLREKKDSPFYVYLKEKAAKSLGALGLSPADYFRGKVVQVTGTVHELKPEPSGPQRFELVALDIDQLTVVRTGK